MKIASAQSGGKGDDGRKADATVPLTPDLSGLPAESILEANEARDRREASWFKADGTFRRNVLRRCASPETKQFARQARENQTPTEKIIWQRLRRMNLGFRRSVVILGWIVDFYHPKSKTVIEIDGGYHDTPDQRRKDAYRDSVMLRRGLRILRIPVAHVESDLDSVVQRIVLNASPRAGVPSNVELSHAPKSDTGTTQRITPSRLPGVRGDSSGVSHLP